MFPGYRKYHAGKTEYNGNIYDSAAEAGYAAELDLRMRAKEIMMWERQIPFQLEAYGKKICKYFVDFKVNHWDLHIEYVDVKGCQTRDFRIKWKMFLAYLAKNEPTAKAILICRTRRDKRRQS